MERGLADLGKVLCCVGYFFECARWDGDFLKGWTRGRARGAIARSSGDLLNQSDAGCDSEVTTQTDDDTMMGLFLGFWCSVMARFRTGSNFEVNNQINGDF
jgi:hypothetical protein